MSDIKKKKIKEPKTKGVAKVPVVMQLETLECGAACLTMILAYYGKWIPLEQVREDCGVSRDGSSAKNILIAARSYGMKATGYKTDVEGIREDGTFPCIIHWNFNHFVVLDGFKGNKVYLNDPARGTITVSKEEFESSFTGVYLAISPGENFCQSGKPKSILEFAQKRLKGSLVAIVFTILSLIISNLLGVISPAFSRIFMDRLLTGTDLNWAGPFFIGLAIFNIIQIIVSAISQIYSLRISGKMSVVGSSTYMWKVLHMPIAFFSQRMVGDIQGRQSSNGSISETIINAFAPLVINAVMMVFYFAVMLRYSQILTIVGLTSLTLNALVSNIISKKMVNITRVSMRDQAKLSSTTVSGIGMIETIKSAGAENGFFSKWAGYQASVNAQQIKAKKLTAVIGMIPQFISMFANNVVVILGVWLTMNGEFTVGMIMAFQGLLSSFFSPALSLVRTGQTLQQLRTEMERVNDVMEYRQDDIFGQDFDEISKKLSGKVEIKDVTFGYAPLGAPTVKNFNLNLEQGKSVAIVGGSGCGKSTMSKLISGLYKPWSGEILFDGKPLNEIESGVFHSSVAVVDQDIILFEDTIANNIKMWDNSIEDFEMILAARDAQIHEDIMERPQGYNSKLIEGGKDFSGGQRQRIEIARVLAQDPTIIILDEATSALDAKTEYDVVKAIKDRGISLIVIAHRLSTIRSCDEIIVMSHGEIIDRGKHSQLMQTSKLYRDLVISE